MSDLVLAVPFGLYPGHTPWGAEVLRDYLKYKLPEVNVFIWDLRYEDRILKLFEEYSDCISITLNLLFKVRYQMEQPFRDYGPDSRANYIFVILRYGGDIFSILQSEKIPFDVKNGAVLQKKLQELKKHFESIIQDKIQEHSGRKRRVVFGISVYERTLFETLYLASIARRAKDGVSVIAGGEAMNISIGRAIVERNNEIDGVVVGLGEMTLFRIMHAFLNGTEVRDMEFELDGL